MGIGTERSGYLLLDPGYHVSRVVTIMEDKLYPHTGTDATWNMMKIVYFTYFWPYLKKEGEQTHLLFCILLSLGCFVQEDNGKKRKEYDYTVASSDYVSWSVTETKSDYQSGWTNLIFVGQPFLSGVDFAERRNLLYDFKSILQRDCKGRLLAGMYFPTNPVSLLIIYTKKCIILILFV